MSGGDEAEQRPRPRGINPWLASCLMLIVVAVTVVCAVLVGFKSYEYGKTQAELRMIRACAERGVFVGTTGDGPVVVECVVTAAPHLGLVPERGPRE